MTQKYLLTVDEVCELLNISRSTFNQWRFTGKLPTIKFGSRVYVKTADLDKVLDDHKEVVA